MPCQGLGTGSCALCAAPARGRGFAGRKLRLLIVTTEEKGLGEPFSFGFLCLCWCCSGADLSGGGVLSVVAGVCISYRGGRMVWLSRNGMGE